MASTIGTYELLAAAALSIPAIYLAYSAIFSPTPTQSTPAEEPKEEEKKVMQAERTDLAPPKDDPWTQEQLKEFNGSDPNKPIYVAIKGIYKYTIVPTNYSRLTNRDGVRRVS